MNSEEALCQQIYCIRMVSINAYYTGRSKIVSGKTFTGI